MVAQRDVGPARGLTGCRDSVGSNVLPAASQIYLFTFQAPRSLANAALWRAVGRALMEAVTSLSRSFAASLLTSTSFMIYIASFQDTHSVAVFGFVSST